MPLSFRLVLKFRYLCQRILGNAFLLNNFKKAYWDILYPLLEKKGMRRAMVNNYLINLNAESTLQ